MLRICLRVIEARLAQLSSDLLGLIATPHRTFEEIAERRASFVGWTLLVLVFVLGYPGFFILPRVQASETGYELVGTAALPSLPFMGGLISIGCALLYQLVARQSIPWRRLIRTAGYPILPYLIWLVFISVLFTSFAQRTPEGHVASPVITHIWGWSFLIVAILAIRLQVLATSAILRCSMAEACLVVGTSIVAINAVLWGTYRAGVPLVTV